ncbi:MAG: carbohydrate-binding protein, partial [Butyrivibrio sp.]|nr:carbohydrate-binding protein [Butyrivibrio sp.]
MKRQMTVLSSIALGGLMVLNNSVDVNAAPALNPYNGVEAEVNFGQSGTKVVTDGDVKAVSSIDSGDYFIVKDVNFSKGVSKFKVNAKADSASLIEIRDGGADGDVIANIKIGATKGEYKEFVIDSSVKIDGKKTIAFVGKMGSVAIDKWSAVEASDDVNEDAAEFPADPETGKTGEGDFVSPYDGITTEEIAKESKGVEQEDYKDKKVLTSLEQDDYYVVHNLKFDKGIAAFTASIKADEPSVVEVRADGVEGTLL